MYEYTCTPRTRLWYAYLSVPGLVLGAVAIWITMTLWELPYPLVFYTASLFLLTGALLVTVRCLLWRFVYGITATEDGGFDFVVLQMRGRWTSTVCRCICRVSVEQLCAIEPEPKKRRVRPTYRWCVLPRDRAYLLTITDDGETVIGRFAPDAAMAAMIEAYLRTRPQ